MAKPKTPKTSSKASKTSKTSKTSSVKNTFNGRAETKRLNSRVSAIENQSDSTQKQFSPQQQDEVDFAEEFAKLTKNEKNRLINPLRVDNLSVTQVFAGWDKTDIRFAQRISIKNTRLLEKFTRAAEVIAKNTTYKKDQDTSIKNQRKKKQARENVSVAQGKSCEGGEGKGGFGLWALLGAAAKLLWEAIKLAWAGIVKAWEFIREWIGKGWKWVVDKFLKIKKWITDSKGWKWVVDKWEKLKNWIKKTTKGGWKWIVDKWEKLKNWIKKATKGGWEWVVDKWEKLKKWLKDPKGTWAKAKKFFGNIKNWITDTTKGGLEWIQGRVAAIKSWFTDPKKGWKTATKLFSDMKIWVTDTWSVISKKYDSIVNWGKDKVKKVADVAKAAKNKTVSLAKKGVSVVKGAGNSLAKNSKGVVKGGKKALVKVGGWMSDIYNGGKALAKEGWSKAIKAVKWTASKFSTVLKKLAPKILRRALTGAIGILLGAATIAGAPVIAAIIGAGLVVAEIWMAYTLAIDVLIATGVLTEKQVEDAEAEAMSLLGFNPKTGTTPSKAEIKKHIPDQKKVTKLKVIRKDKKIEELIKLKEEIDELRFELRVVT